MRLFWLLLVAPTVLAAQSSVDIWPPALVGTWSWGGVDQSLEVVSMALVLEKNGEGVIGATTPEDYAAGIKPIERVIAWRVDYPNWPDRSGRLLCYRGKRQASDAEKCEWYRVLGAKPIRQLLFLDREWEEIRVKRGSP